jgi:4-hydroxy-tetrahydrodipicolinate reductase
MAEIAICGGAGRMGQRLVAVIHEDPEVSLCGAVETADHPKIGTDVGLLAGIGEIGIRLTSLDQISEVPEVLIDFSHASATGGSIEFCLSHKIPLVMATTGLEEEHFQQLNRAAGEIPIVWAANTSLTVNLTMKLAEMAGRSLKNQKVDVEIIERHHRFKADAPSGTALKFGEIIAREMGQTAARHGRAGITGERPGNEIGYHAVRTGDNPGEHTIIFGMLGETIELKVSASNRDCYAIGAVAAARFLLQQSPGMYTMFDVLGLHL